MSLNAPRISEAGDSALLLEWDEVIDPRVNARAIAMAAAIRDASLPGVCDVVSTFRSVAIFFDPLKGDLDTFRNAVMRLTNVSLEVAHGKTIEGSSQLRRRRRSGPGECCRLGRAQCG